MPDIRRSSFVAGALLFASLSVPAHAQKTPPPASWQGTSDGYTVEWTKQDIVARDAGGNIVFSAKDLATAGFKEFQKDAWDEEGGKRTVRDCSLERRIKVLSLAGSLLSLQDEENSYCQGMPHPTVYIRTTAIDLAAAGAVKLKDMQAEPGKIARLTDYVAVGDLWQAMSGDAVVGTIAEVASAKPPRDVAALAAFFQEKTLTSDEGCDYMFEADWLTRFSLHHVEGDKVAVRLSLPPMSPPCESTTLTLGLLLAPSDKLQRALADAAAGKAGFLQKNAPRMKETVFDFQTGKGAEP